MQEHAFPSQHTCVSVSPSGPVIGLEPGMIDEVAGDQAAHLGVLTDSSSRLSCVRIIMAPISSLKLETRYFFQIERI